MRPERVVAIVCGRAEVNPFPGRNTFPLLGRPMLHYPLLAALHADAVDRVYLSTDNETMALAAGHLGAERLDRPAALREPSTTLEPILSDAFGRITASLGERPALAVVLLANAPTVTPGLIMQGIDMMRADPSLDAVSTVTAQRAYEPAMALRVAPGGLLKPYLDPAPPAREPVYFPDSLLWILRGALLERRDWSGVGPNEIVNPARDRTAALVHEGYGDIDYPWQVPAAEHWLRRNGFTETSLPYASPEGASAGPRPARVVRRAPPERRVFVSTVPFAQPEREAQARLEASGFEVEVNPLGRRLQEDELKEFLPGSAVLIAGTEPVTRAVIEAAPDLRLIARVGVGLDNVDLRAARERGIAVTYTPEAPAAAVAELAVGLMLASLRHVAVADRQLRQGVWHRLMGRRLAGLTVGICGVGRIGARVARHLAGGFPGITLLGFDRQPDACLAADTGLRWCAKDELIEKSDVVTLHLPLTPETRGFIASPELGRMKKTALLVNTARGAVVNERDLAQALRAEIIAGAAVDVFDREPYAGELVGLTRALLTCHMGSMSHDCRTRMELEAVEEAVRWREGRPLKCLVPDAEVALQERPA